MVVFVCATPVHVSVITITITTINSGLLEGLFFQHGVAYGVVARLAGRFDCFWDFAALQVYCVRKGKGMGVNGGGVCLCLFLYIVWYFN